MRRRLFMAPLFFVLLFKSTACSTRAPSYFPVRWPQQHLGIKSLNDLDKLRETPVKITFDDELELTGKNGSKVKVTNGKEYLALKTKGYYAYSTYAITMESWFIKQDGHLTLLKKAMPSKYSWVNSFSFKNNPLAVLPPELGPYLSGDEGRRVEAMVAQGKTWREIFPKTKIRKVTPTEISLANAALLITFTVIAFGDFNNDDIEALLVFYSCHALQGTFRSYRYVLLTRKSHAARLTILPNNILPGTND